MMASPFAVTIYLDFDARPCSPRFAQQLFALVAPAAPGVDLALTNKFDGQGSLTLADHLTLEHNSACVVLADSARTRRLLALYLESFLAFQALAEPVTRDQPALAVALKKAVLSSDALQHADISSRVFCRAKISAVVSCDAGCLLVHKPQKHDLSFKTFVVGSKQTGAESVAMMLDALKLAPRCDVAQSRARRLPKRRVSNSEDSLYVWWV